MQLIWLPRWLYNLTPWIYLSWAGAIYFYAPPHPWHDFCMSMLTLMGGYIIFMRFLYGYADSGGY